MFFKIVIFQLASDLTATVKNFGKKANVGQYNAAQKSFVVVTTLTIY